MSKVEELRKLFIAHCESSPQGEASAIARTIGVTPGTLSDFKNGRRDPHVSVCEKLSAELKRRAQVELDAPLPEGEGESAALREIGRQLKSLGALLLSPSLDLRLQAQWLVGRIDELSRLRAEIVRLYVDN